MAIIFLSVASESWAQSQDYLPESLFITLDAYGEALVQYDVRVAGQDATIPLFGSTINNLTVTDPEGNNVDFEVGTGEITVHTTGASKIRYSTPDLVVRENRILTLLVNSPAGLSVQLPKGSSVVDWGQVLPSSVNSENLLVFPSGDVHLKYVLGLLGTEERANAMIGLAQQAMNSAAGRYPDIMLSGPMDMLQQAMAAENAGDYLVAESLSVRTIDQIGTTIRDYEAVKESIRQADSSISNAASRGLDTSAAASLQRQAEDEFQAGNYLKARESAIKAVSTVGNAQQSNVLIFAVVGAVAAVIAAFFVLKRSQKPAQVSSRPAKESRQPAVSETQTTDQDEETQEIIPVETAVRQNDPIPDSVNDQQHLSKIVTRILEEKPQLRPEDQAVLKFLVDKEGAAFESEIRGRFQLPKTTAWRLVKRLEREELVEIRKAGGQNLIKLRFENRQT